MTKTEAAFRLTCRKFFDTTGHAYFWTFTFAESFGYQDAMKRWNHFCLLTSREWKHEFWGVRVTEFHPGDEGENNSHGFHFHVLCGNRHSWHVMQRLWIRCGGGKVVWVKYVKDMEALRNYLAPYLSPVATNMPKGARRWAVFGKRKGCQVRNVIVKSILAENCRRVRALLGSWSQGLYVYVYRLTYEFGNCLV